MNWSEDPEDGCFAAALAVGCMVILAALLALKVL